MSSLLDSVDIYCERTNPLFFAEPLNAISNIAFIIAAYLLFKTYKKSQKKDIEALILLILVGVVGIGSLLFHTLATRWAMLADVIPITAFIFFYLWVCIRRLLGVSNALSALILIGFYFISTQAEKIPTEYSFNGSIAYFPSLAAIIIIASLLKIRGKAIANRYFMAFICFATSLTFRSVDMSVCPSLSIGTHYMWHILNGLLLFILTKAIIETPKKASN